MRISVNGKEREVGAAALDEALVELGYGGMRVATAVDGAFVPAGRRGAVVLGENSALEVLAPMQGG
ncbi:MAG: sulfur carrier protein ThiS [Gluconacetobacter diazotrophicus]|nr:sulfur carrier protein ThiS [Gluconacetobacter diazotrophicus]